MFIKVDDHRYNIQGITKVEHMGGETGLYYGERRFIIKAPIADVMSLINDTYNPLQHIAEKMAQNERHFYRMVVLFESMLDPEENVKRTCATAEILAEKDLTKTFSAISELQQKADKAEEEGEENEK